MSTQYPRLNLLEGNSSIIHQFAPTAAHEKFLKEEVLRFISIAGTVARIFPNVATSIDERIFSHILLRSLVENFFKIVYVFDDPSKTSERFDKIVDGFRREYAKLYNDVDAGVASQIEPAGSGWSSLQGPPDLNSMLTQVRNTFGDRLNFLYRLYRIGSFDTHGNSLNSLFETVFGKQCKFPFLEINPLIELMADYYLATLGPLVQHA